MRAGRSFRIEALPILFALATNAAAQSFVLVVLPALGRDLGFSPVETGLLLGIAALILLVSAPVWGRVSETRGRRFVLLTGLAGAAVGPALMAVVIALRLDGALDRMPTLALLFAIRAGQSILSGGLLPSAQAWMADSTPPERRAEGMGLLGASYGIGGIAGAGVAFAAGGDMPAAALMGLAAGVGIGFVLVRLLIGDRRERTDWDLGSAPSLRAILPSLIVTFLGITVYGIIQNVTALRLEDGFALPRAEAISRAGGTLMGAAVVMALVQTFGLRLLKLEPARLILIGAIASAIAMMGVAAAGNISMLIVALIVMGAALGLLLPGNLALLSLIAGPQAQGRVAGVNAVAQGLGMAAGPIAGAMLHRLSPVAPPLGATAAMAVTVLVVLIASKGDRR